ncbi:papain-like cysteine protease family protein [Streptomyces sp. NPDC053499]|uniref:papain-like cysteine protease family protein n=1 Tax=Streptomyces sp. NPDC053499 TaxID=3365707 RepID=UPI0037CD6DAA
MSPLALRRQADGSGPRRDGGGHGHARRRRTRSRRSALVAAAAAALLSLPVAVATAAPGSSAPTPDSTHLLAAKRLDISMQAQQMSNWCWAAAGNTISTYMGENYSQNTFCNAAFGRSQGSSCPNSQATLGHVQDALGWMGINPGSYVSGWLRYSTVQNEINANRPVETRIQWSSGGGHMHVLYGYDTSRSWVYWGDPWPSNSRYNWASHGWYVDNYEFSWTHSLYRIGA